MVRYTANGTPSEDDEEEAFADWLDQKGYRHTHFSNEMFTQSIKIKARMKRLGVHSGPPDHLIIVPCCDGKKRTLYIEMKRQKGGEVSDTQWEWLKDLVDCDGVAAFVAKGFEQAQQITELFQCCAWSTLAKLEDNFLEGYQKHQENKKKSAKSRQKSAKSRQIQKNEDIF